ncbi:hypothetical protein MPOCJGCO_2370 [Methylobacterium trifolii]|uniref:Uncharacterized protein n=2 Tax=Methylobacterium trifolii TaxID=1003092 RepID=A0ABQ4U0B7_9HYPH|nr:hypothetical protein MPOCJGCO_2370 [Methylobacterium trifolii]
MKQNFCSEADANKLWDRRVANFKNGIFGNEKDKYTNAPMIGAKRIDLAMPVFETSLSTAVVTVVYTGNIWMKRDPEFANHI